MLLAGGEAAAAGGGATLQNTPVPEEQTLETT